MVERKHRIWLAFGLILGVFVAYSGVYSFEYLYDDEFLIQKNRFLRSFSHLGDIFRSSLMSGGGVSDSFYRPIQGTLYLLVYQMFGEANWAYHLLNISLHAANAVLVFALAQKLRLNVWTAFCVAILWSLHPLHTEAVTYMSATADPLHAFFVLAGLNLAAPTFKPWRLAGALMLFVCALLSKESALAFPALLFTLCFFFAARPKGQWQWRTYLPTLPFWLVAVAYFISRKTWLDFNGDLTMFKQENIYTESILVRIATFLATLPAYFELIVWPHDLHIDRQFSVFVDFFSTQVLIGLAMVILLAVGSVRWRWMAWVALWLVAAHVIQSGILIPVNSFFLEHWMYVPTIGVFLGLGALSEYLKLSTRTLVAGTLILASVLGFATYLHNPVWKDPITLFSHILKNNPGADRVRHNLAMAYSERGRTELALQQYAIVLERTNQYPQTHHNMARIYLDAGRIQEAEASYQKAISIDPRFFQSYAGLVELYTKTGDLKKAEEFKKKFDELIR